MGARLNEYTWRYKTRRDLLAWLVVAAVASAPTAPPSTAVAVTDARSVLTVICMSLPPLWLWDPKGCGDRLALRVLGLLALLVDLGWRYRLAPCGGSTEAP